jgi:isopenicillin-N N-acyltransferase-like protein
MSLPLLDRRAFLRRSAVSGAVLGGVLPCRGAADQKPAAEHSLTVVNGKPRERGRSYGRAFKDPIAAFLDREVYKVFDGKPSTRAQMLAYAGQCGQAIRSFAPIIHDELEGMAEGSGLRLEELVLLNLHEELTHKGVLPKVGHCTAVALGPPCTRDGHTYVGQTWDWMPSVYGLSSMLLWQRPEGPSLLAYAYPGLWVGAGLNSAGIALCWTSAGGKEAPGPRVGIPSYALLTHLLYQESLDAVMAEAKRATHAGWFTFVLADGKGQLLNVEGSPKGLAVEPHEGQLSRVGYGSQKMTGTAEGDKVKVHPRCQKMSDWLETRQGKLDGVALQDHFTDLKGGICLAGSTIDMMVYNTSTREAFVSRGPGFGPARWKSFTFPR